MNRDEVTRAIDRAIDGGIGDEDEPGADLHGLLESLGMIDPAPAAHDRAVLNAAFTAAAFDRGEDADIAPALMRLGMIEDPPAVHDQAVRAAARKVNRWTKLAASAFGWVRDGHVFETVTAMSAALGLAIVVAATYGGKAADRPQADLHPRRTEAEGWIVLPAPGDKGVTIRGERGREEAQQEPPRPVATASTAVAGDPRPIDQILGGGARIGELRAGGELEVERAIPLHARAKAPGRIRVTELQVEGDVDREQLKRELGENLFSVQTCYESVLGARAIPPGSARVRITIAPDGTAPSPEIDARAVADPDLASCVRKAVASSRWPSAGGNPARLDLTVAFEVLSAY